MHPDENNRTKKLKSSVPKPVGWGTARAKRMPHSVERYDFDFSKSLRYLAWAADR
jgi:hypothetical protein